LAIHQCTQGSLFVSHNQGGDIGCQVFEHALGIIVCGDFNLSECGYVLVHERQPLHRSILPGDEAGVRKVD
jgi:hypothetical protein